MSNLTRCVTCGGRKQIIGMGMIKKECPDCKGVGHVSAEKKEENILKDKVNDTNKKRGRKKKEA